MRRLKLELAPPIPKTRREVYLRVHTDRGVEWGVRRQ